MKKQLPVLVELFIVAIIVLLVAAIGAQAQSPCDGVQLPPGAVCISQQAANAAAQLAREAALKDEKIKVLESALIDKDKIAADNKDTARKNEADLREALQRTEIRLAEKTGTLIGCEASNTRNLAVIDVLLKNVRPKKIGLINF